MPHFSKALGNQGLVVLAWLGLAWPWLQAFAAWPWLPQAKAKAFVWAVLWVKGFA